MTIQKVLREDHREIFDLLKRVSQARSSSTREKHFVEMKQFLDIHISLEQLIFYEALAKVKENQDVILRFISDHQEIMDSLAELDSLLKEEPEWMLKFQTLKKRILRHFREEETDLFRRAKKTIPEKRLEQLGAEMATRTAEQLAVQ